MDLGCVDLGWWSLGGLDGLGPGDPQQLVVARREDGVRMAGGGPDRVVARQADVDEGADRLQVADRRDPADDEPGRDCVCAFRVSKAHESLAMIAHNSPSLPEALPGLSG